MPSASTAVTCDNGTEFTCNHVDAWAHYAQMEIAFVNSFCCRRRSLSDMTTCKHSLHGYRDKRASAVPTLPRRDGTQPCALAHRAYRHGHCALYERATMLRE